MLWVVQVHAEDREGDVYVDSYLKLRTLCCTYVIKKAENLHIHNFCIPVDTYKSYGGHGVLNCYDDSSLSGTSSVATLNTYVRSYIH